MGKVRKRTSKRSGLRLKYSIQKKASESRKKMKKEARKVKKLGLKKMRSKHTKNSIPNNYPFKEELMDQMERVEIEMEEKKQLMKSLKIANKQLPRGQIANLTQELEAKIEKREIQQSGLTEKELEAAEELHKKVTVETRDKYKDLGRKQAKKYLKGLLQECNLFIQVLDCRDAQGSRNEEAEEVIKALGKKQVNVLTKVDLVPEEEVGQIRNKLGKEVPTLAFREGDQQFLSKLKKAFSDEKGKLKKFDQEKEVKLIGVIGYPFVGKETLIDNITELAKQHNEKKEEEEMEDEEEGEDEEMGEEEMEEEAQDIVIGNGFSIVKIAAQTLKKEQSKGSMIMQSVFCVDELIPTKQLEAHLMNPEVIKPREICRAYRIPSSFKDFGTLLEIVQKKQKLASVEEASRKVFQDALEGKLRYLIK